MLKLSHNSLIQLSGVLWLAIGSLLLFLGVNFLTQAFENPSGNHPLFNALAPYMGDREIVAVILLVVALFIGFFKGKLALGRSAARVTARIRSLPNPAPLSQAYSKGYCLLIAFMICLGISLKYLGLPNDVRGLIDIAIGAALINGGKVYFRLAQQPKAT